MKKYCVYSNFFSDNLNLEHIFPLSLGGCDDFVIEVDRDFNSHLGSKIDGALANDFLVLFDRDKFSAVGHSGKHPKPVLKKVTLLDGRPAHASFGKDGLQIYDLVNRRPLPKTDIAGSEIRCQFKIDMFADTQFVAKVALAAGYFAYGEYFIKHAQHEELRKIIYADKLNMPLDVNARHFDRFDESDDPQFSIVKLSTEVGACSSVVILPSSQSFGVAVGVLGKFMGFISVPCESKFLPKSKEFKLGHCMYIQDGKLKRFSFDHLRRKLLKTYFPEGE